MAANIAHITDFARPALCLVVSQDLRLCAQLKAALYALPYSFLLAHSVERACEHLREQSFHLVLSDLQDIQEAKGFFEQLQQMHPDTVHVLLTDESAYQSALQLLHAGYTAYFLLKPLEEKTLFKRLRHVFNHVQLLMENTWQQEQIESQHKQQEQENQIAQKVQRLLLAKNELLNIPGLCVRMIMPPHSTVDGDFFDFYQAHPASLDFVMGDVCGQGLPAALMATVVKTQFARFALPTQRVQVCAKANVWRDDLLLPDEIIKRVFQEVSHPLMQLEQFVSVFYGRFDFQKQMFFYENCGFAPPLYFQHAHNTFEELLERVCPLGVTQEQISHLKAIPFASHDVFLLYSDNLLRTPAVNGESFSVERFKQVLKVHHALEADLLGEKIEEEVVRFFTATPLKDTFTIVLVKIPEYRPIKQANHNVVKFCSSLEQVHVMRQFIASCFDQAPGDSEQFIAKMQLCANEAFCNIVTHGYGEKTGEIVVYCELQEEGGLMGVLDQGCEFDPAMVAYPNFVGSQEHGFGWYMMRQLMDEMVYVKKNSSHGWNHLRMFKKYIPCEVSMEISHKNKHGVLVITFDGDHLDAKNSAQCKEYVLDAIKREQTYSVIFDLHLLKFIDSSGLGMFLSLLKELHTHGGELKLAEMSKTVRTVFELVCMHKIFDIFPTVDAALKALQEQLSTKK